MVLHLDDGLSALRHAGGCSPRRCRPMPQPQVSYGVRFDDRVKRPCGVRRRPGTIVDDTSQAWRMVPDQDGCLPRADARRLLTGPLSALYMYSVFEVSGVRPRLRGVLQ
jgi:hypothetical protein